MSTIKDIKARQILDSRGNPTIEVKIFTELGNIGVFAVPSGASVGSKEALELRDNEESYNGKSVLKAVNNVNTIIKNALIGKDVKNQKEIDETLIKIDNTENKSNLGANATIGVSVACIKAAALDEKETLYNYLNKREKSIPKAMFNIVNGGSHAANNIDIQEFMIVPKFEKFAQILECASKVFQALKKILKEKNLSTGVGDEGGFAPDLKNNSEALELIIKSIETAEYEPGKQVFIALDCAASSFYKNGKYLIDGKELNRDELLDYYINLCKRFPIISIEDPFDEEDYEGFKKITEVLGKGILIVGDDLFVTNKKYLQYGLDNKLCNAILIKPNQIGTFYEMLETIVLAKKNNYTCIMSHRSGETTDTFIADAAVSLNTPFIKTGSVSRGERICKYNRLLEIEEELGI